MLFALLSSGNQDGQSSGRALLSQVVCIFYDDRIVSKLPFSKGVLRNLISSWLEINVVGSANINRTSSERCA